jgi:hypothetical protein
MILKLIQSHNNGRLISVWFGPGMAWYELFDSGGSFDGTRIVTDEDRIIATVENRVEDINQALTSERTSDFTRVIAVAHNSRS